METLDKLFNSFPEIGTERLRLRETTPRDVPAIFACYRDAEVMRYYDSDVFVDEQQAARVVTSRQTRFQEKRGIRWTIATKSDNLAIGSIGLHAMVPYFFKTEIGYDLMRNYWNQGIMTEALTAVLNFCFHQVGFNRIEALVMPGNSASLHLLAKLGFENEGLLREYGYWKGAFHDLYMLSLLKKSGIN